MKTRLSAILIAICLFLVATAAMGQTTVTVSGRVTDPDNRPVRGVFVNLTNTATRQGAGGQTDSTGAYRVSVAPGTYNVTATPPANTPLLRFTRENVSVTAALTLDIRLERGVVLSGTVKDPDGKPVKGASVSLSAQSQFFSAQSGDDGRYSVVARPGTYTLSVRPPPGTSFFLAARSGFALRADTSLDLTFQRGNVVSGRVTDPDNRPVRGVFVTLIDPATRQGDGTPTDSTGAFRITVRPGTYDLSISPPRGTPYLFERRAGLEVRADLTLNITLKRGVLVSGIVRDPDGKRLQNAFVNLYDPRARLSYGAGTDADGAYAFAAPPGAYNLRVSPPPNTPLLPLVREGLELEVTADLRLDFTLEKGRVLSGRVTDPDNRPVQNASVNAYNLKTQLSAGSPTDAQGQYRIVLSPGVYNVTVRPPSGSPLSPREVKDYQVASDQTLDVKLDRGTLLTGRVTDPDNRPVQNASVSLSAQGQFYGAQTDSAGRYRVSARPGTFTVTVRPPRESPLIAREMREYQVRGDQTLDVKLDRGAILTGRVTDPDGRPVRNVNVSLYSQQLKTGGGAQTDSTGRYRIVLLPGTYTLSVRPPQGSPFVPPRDIREYKLAGDQTHDVKLEQGKVLSGRVTDPENRPVLRANVNAFSQQLNLSAGAQTDSTGRYRLVLTPGAYDITVSPPQGAALLSVRAEKTNVFADVTLDFKLEKGASLAGLVTGPDRQPVQNVNVSAYDPRLKTGNGARTGADGRYTMVLKKGEYDVTASPPSATSLIPWRQSGVKVEGERRLDIALVRGVLLSGRVTDPDGKPLLRANVYASNPQGGAGAQTDSTGQYRIALLRGVYRVSVSPPPGAVFTGQTRENVEVLKDTSLDVRLQSGLVLSGTVTDASGEPVENVPVSAYSRQAAFGAGARTDTAGVYRMVLKPGVYEVTVNPDQKTGLTRQVLPGVEVKADRQIDIALRLGLTLSGRVHGAKGGGIQGVSVTAQDENVTNGPEDTEVTDRNGAFALTLLPGVYQVSLRPPAETQFLPLTLNNVEVKADRRGFEIKLDDGLVLTGRVIDPEGKPIREASVSASGQSEKFSAGAGTDPDGVYRLVLKRGVYRLSVSPPRRPGEVSDLLPRSLSDVRVTENATLNIALDRGVLLSGRVTDRAGHPLPEVSVSASTRQAYAGGAQTDADGRYRIPLRPDVYFIYVNPRPTTAYIPRRFEQVEVKAARALDAVLDEGLVLSGKVTDPDGDPVEGVSIRAGDQDKSDGEEGSARTGPEGTYRIPLPAGIYDVDAFPPDGSGLLRATASGVNLTAHKTLDFKLTKGLSLTGRAARPDGQPLPDVRVSLFNPQTGEWFGAQTRKDGSYTLTLPPAVYRLRAEPPAGSEFVVKEIKEIEIRADQKLDLPFDRGSVLSGRVTDPDGRPVSGVSIGAAGVSGGNFGALSRADGTYSLALPQGVYNLGIYPRPGDLIPQGLRSLEVKGDQKLDVKLERGLLLSGRVTDGKGNAVKQVNVRADDGKGSAGGASVDQDGRYRIPLKPGTYKVTFDPFGSKFVRKVVENVDVRAARTLDAALDEGVTLSGKVTDPAGDGAEDIVVNAHRENRHVRGVSTFLDGTYSLALPPGTYTLTFDPKPGAPLVRQTLKDLQLDADRKLDVALAAGLVLSGRVTGPTGAGVAKAGVSIRNAETGDAYGAGADAEGNYRQTLPPGTYIVTVGPPPASRLAVKQVKDVRLTASRTLDVQLDHLTGLSGRVLDPDKKPVPFARIVAEAGGKGQGGAGADDRGAYSLILPPGVYAITVHPPPRSALRRARLDTVKVSSDQTLDLSLARGVGLSGKVTDGAGRGLEKINVSLFNTSTREWVGTSTASDGTYGLGLEAGTYDLHVTPSDPASRFVRRRLTALEIKTDRTLDIQLDQGALVTGRVIDAAGNPLPRVSVTGRDTSGAVYGRSTDEKGAYAFAIPAGTYTVEAYPPAGTGFIPKRTANVKVSGEFKFDITLDKGVTLKGRVTDPDSAGVYRASVRAFQPETGESYGAGADMDGRYTLALPPGTYRVEVRPPEGRSLLRKDLMNVAITADRTLDVSLDRGAILSGRILTPAGDRGVASVEMIFIQKGKGPAAEAETNPDGFYRVALPLGLYLVAYNPPPLKGYLPALVDSVLVEQARTLDLRLEEGTALIGRVLGPGDAPAPGVILTATGKKGEKFSSITTSDGLFRLLLPAGVYDLEAQPSASSGLASQKVPAVDAGAGKPLDIKLTAATGPVGPARAVKVASSASSLPADGTSTLTLTVTVTQTDGSLSSADDSTTVVFSVEGPADIKPGRVRVKGGVGSALIASTTVAGKIEIVAASAGLVAGKVALASFAAGADADSTAITTGPVVTDITPATAAVLWGTDRAADGSVEFGTTPALGATVADTAKSATKHRVLLTDLKPSTVYHYRVTSGGTLSRTLSFTTEAPASENGKSALEVDLDPAPGNQKVKTGTGVKAGQTVELTVYAADVKNVAGFLLDLDFDPDALSFVSAASGVEAEKNLLTTGGGNAVFLSPVVKGGSVRFGGSILAPSEETVASGDGLLGRFTFKTAAGFGAGREAKVSLTRAVLKGLSAAQQDTLHIPAAATLTSGETAAGRPDPIVLDADPAPGDQGKRTLTDVQPGAAFDLEVLATAGAAGLTGFTVRVEFDPKKLAFVSFKEGDLIPDLRGLPSPGDGVIEVGAAMLGSGSGASKDSGLLGSLRFQLDEDATGTATLTLTSASFVRKGAQQEKFTVRTTISVVAGGEAVKSPADFDGDGAVDFNDFFLFAAAFGAKKGDRAFDEKFDLDKSGAVDFSDFFAFASEFGKSSR